MSNTAELKHDARFSKKATVAKQFKDVAHDVVDQVADRAEAAERQVREQVAEKEGALRETADIAAKRSNKLADDIKKFTRERPLTTAGIAFVAGLATSLMVGRK